MGADAVHIMKGPWEFINLPRAMVDPDQYIFFRDDFLLDRTAVASDYTETKDGGGSDAILATEAGGVFQYVTGGTDNNEYTLTVGATAAMVKATVSSGKRLAFEARVKSTTITDRGFFVGLGEETLGADFLNDDDGDVVGTVDAIGFNVRTATPTEIDCVYQKGSATAVEVQGNAGTDAAAWMKLGFSFDGGNEIRYFVDRVLVARASAVGTTYFPSGEELTPVIAAKTGTGSAVTGAIDWWMVAQQR